jgi:hypothetical protein
MPLDDPSDLNAENRALKKRVERLEAGTGAGAGDSDHAGAGFESIVLGDGAEATDTRGISFGKGAYNDSQNGICIGYSSLVFGAANGIAIGRSAQAKATAACALGDATRAWHASSVALGVSAQTTATNQIMLGTASETVVVPGTFSNPSARRLKKNITPAPVLHGIFPELVEYEKKAAPGPRHLGYIADDLVGTPAERFVTFDDDGAPNGIDYLSLLVAQVAQLRAELAALKNETKG